jgi:hypothetical protein
MYQIFVQTLKLIFTNIIFNPEYSRAVSRSLTKRLQLKLQANFQVASPASPKGKTPCDAHYCEYLKSYRNTHLS